MIVERDGEVRGEVGEAVIRERGGGRGGEVSGERGGGVSGERGGEVS